MTPEQRDSFLREPRTAVLSTLRSDGSIHAVPVWFRWDGERFRILTGRDSVKRRNLARDARATL